MFDNLRDTLDFDDLLFESRNRDYGAYQLRKKYNSVMAAGILIASLMVSAVVILPFVITPRSDKFIAGGLSYVQVHMDALEPPMDEVVVPPPPPPEDAARMQEIVKYVPPVVVDSVMPLEADQTTTDDVLAQSPTENFNAAGTGTGDDLLSGQEGINSDDAFFIVEVMPSFKGGDLNKFSDWVRKRTNYPQAAIENRIEGKVYVTFVIETDGSVTNVTVVKGVDPLIDKEAVRTIQSSPKWSPGLQRGQAVRVRCSMALNFAL